MFTAVVRSKRRIKYLKTESSCDTKYKIYCCNRTCINIKFLVNRSFASKYIRNVNHSLRTQLGAEYAFTTLFTRGKIINTYIVELNTCVHTW